MYRKDVNERSPMRVFEKSIHGGLGKGNVGVVAARAGLELVTQDLPRDTFAARWLAEIGVTRG